jgi:hypothetical protein
MSYSTINYTTPAIPNLAKGSGDLPAARRYDKVKGYYKEVICPRP